MLSGCTRPRLAIACDRCGRRATFVTADVLKTMGEIGMTDLLKHLVPDCPRVNETRAYELCRVRYEPDATWERGRPPPQSDRLAS